jgi:ribonuclease BN (tRNA processing enzyme)
MDCGSGTLHGLARGSIDWTALTHVAISHYHSDHIADLSSLILAFRYGLETERAEPLTLLGPPGFGLFLDGLAAVLGAHVLEPGFPVDVVELGPGDEYRHAGSGATIHAQSTPHTDESVAYRVTGAAGRIGYTGDTGPSDEVAHFLTGCRVLIAECALTDPPEMDLHLAPSTLARMANIAGPELLVITHVYPPAEPSLVAEQLAVCGYTGRVVEGVDGLQIGLGDDLTVASLGTPV